MRRLPASRSHSTGDTLTPQQYLEASLRRGFLLISHERKNQIKLAIERHLKGEPSDIESISLEELRDTHALLGDRDWIASYRIALRNRIKTLEEKGRRTHSRVRALQYVVAILSTLIVGILLWQYFG